MLKENNLHFALLIVRWMIGVIMTMAGYWKVFVLSAHAHAERFFVQGFAESWIPEWLLWTLGTIIPYFELLTGIMLLIGFRIREALIGLGVLHIITTYGHALQQGLFDIDGHTFTRLALIIFLLMCPTKADIFTLDSWIARKNGAYN